MSTACSGVPGAQRRALFVFPHQDDEHGVFPILEQLTASGGQAICAYVTNGASRQPSGRRNQESLSVLRQLGVCAEDVRFLGEEQGIADGQLHLHLDAAYRAVMDAVQHRGPIHELYVPCWEGGHQDHDAAHAMGLAVAASLGLLEATRQFPLYGGRGLPWILFRVFHPLPENGPVTRLAIPWRKRWAYASLCLRYPSQLATWVGLFPFVLLDLMFAGVQRLQPVCAERLSSKPHEGRLLYERRGFLSYDRFVAAVAPFVTSHLANADVSVRAPGDAVQPGTAP